MAKQIKVNENDVASVDQVIGRKIRIKLTDGETTIFLPRTVAVKIYNLVKS